MPKLCQITVLGLEVRTDWRLVHDRLLDEFPDVTDVLATTMPATILITSRRSVDPDAWLEVISETVEANRGHGSVVARSPTSSASMRGHDSGMRSAWHHDGLRVNGCM